jgi:hypothetical protein
MKRSREKADEFFIFAGQRFCSALLSQALDQGRRLARAGRTEQHYLAIQRQAEDLTLKFVEDRLVSQRDVLDDPRLTRPRLVSSSAICPSSSTGREYRLL